MAGPAPTPDRKQPVRPPPADGFGDGPPRGVWLLLGAIAGAKLATLTVVLWLSWSPEAGLLAAVTVWHWLPLAAALLAGPVLFRVRLRRVRARREALRRAEWLLPETAGAEMVAGVGATLPRVDT